MSLYGHPSMVEEHARAFSPAPACFSVTVTEFTRVLRACRLRSSVSDPAAAKALNGRCSGRFYESMERLEKRLRSMGYDLDELDQDNPFHWGYGAPQLGASSGDFDSCSASTTATNSTRVEKPGKNV